MTEINPQSFYFSSYVAGSTLSREHTILANTLRAPVGKLNLMLQLPWLDVDVSNLHCLANYTGKLSHVTVFRIIDLNSTRW